MYMDACGCLMSLVFSGAFFHFSLYFLILCGCNIRRTKENTACNTNQKTIRVLYGGMRVIKEYCKASSFYGV